MSPEEAKDLKEFFSGELEKVRGEVAELRGLPEEVAKLRGLPEEVGALRAEIKEVHSELLDFEGHVAKHFGRVDQRLDAFDRRFDSVDRRFDSVDGRFDSVDGRFDSVDGQLREERASREPLQDDLRKVAEGVVTNGERIDRLRDEMHEEFAAVRGEMKAGIDSVHDRVARLEAT